MRLRTDIVWRRVDGSIVALDLRTSRYYSVNPTAAVLWELLQADTDGPALAKALVAEYAVDAGRADTDSRQFVAALRGHGLLDD